MQQAVVLAVTVGVSLKTLGVQRFEIERELFYRFASLYLLSGKFRAAHFVKAGRAAGNVTRKAVHILDRNVQFVASGVAHDNVIARYRAHRNLLYALAHSHAVHVVNDVFADFGLADKAAALFAFYRFVFRADKIVFAHDGKARVVQYFSATAAFAIYGDRS